MTITDAPLSNTTSPSLLGRAVSGDGLAWQRIVQIYGPIVYSWARRTGLRPQDAADVTQETFTALATRLVNYDSQRPGATFRGWLWTITRNKAADHVRQLRSQPGGRGGSTNLTKLNAVSDSEILEAGEENPTEIESDQQDVIRRALAILRSSFEAITWQAFWRTVVDGCSPDEVAQELSISRWAVYKSRSRVLQKLRTQLEGLEDLS